MELETRYSKERMEIEHGQYFEFVAEAEFYAVNDSDDEESKNAKLSELDRIIENLAAAASFDLNEEHFGSSDDPLTRRLNKSKFNELQTDYYHAIAVIHAYMNEGLPEFIAYEAHEAFKYGAQERDLILFGQYFIQWVDDILSGKNVSWIGHNDYQQTVEMADSALVELNKNPDSNSVLIDNLRKALENFASLGAFPDYVQEVVLKSNRYGKYYEDVMAAMKCAILPEDDPDASRSKIIQITGFMKKVKREAKEELRTLQSQNPTNFEIQSVRSDMNLALAYMHASMYGEGNGLTLYHAERALSQEKTKQKSLYYIQTLEAWMQRVENGEANILRCHADIEEWIKDINTGIESLQDENAKVCRLLSPTLREEIQTRLASVRDALSGMGSFPNNVLVTNNITLARKHLSSTR